MAGLPHTLILGVGSPLMGDDAVGVIAIQRLREHPALPPGVDVVDGGTDGLGLIPLMEQYGRVILVDAVPMGLPAGSIRRFTWGDARLVGHERSFSLHPDRSGVPCSWPKRWAACHRKLCSTAFNRERWSGISH